MMSTDSSSTAQNVSQELLLPALEPPSGISSDFANPGAYNTSGYALLSFFLFLGTGNLLSRLYSQFRYLGRLHFEDYLAIAGYGMYVGWVGYCCIGLLISPGFYVHMWKVRASEMSRILYSFYTHSMGLLKVAIILQWLRIFNPLGSRNAFFWSSLVVLCVNVLFYTALLIAQNFICIPMRKIWDTTIPGSCFDSNPLCLAGSIINFITDIFVLFSPQKTIWDLNMTKTKRLWVSFVFAVGLTAACSIAAFRLTAHVKLPNTPDFTYILAEMALSSTADMLLLLVVFCAPALWGLLSFRRVSSVLSYFKGRGGSSSNESAWSHERLSTRSRKGYQMGSDRYTGTDDDQEMSAIANRESGSIIL